MAEIQAPPCPLCGQLVRAVSNHVSFTRNIIGYKCDHCGQFLYDPKTGAVERPKSLCMGCGVEGVVVRAAEPKTWRIDGCTCGHVFRFGDLIGAFDDDGKPQDFQKKWDEAVARHKAKQGG